MESNIEEMEKREYNKPESKQLPMRIHHLMAGSGQYQETPQDIEFDGAEDDKGEGEGD